MHKRALTALFAVFAIAAVVAGCGGGSDSTSSGGTGDSTGGVTDTTESSSSGSAPTKAAFIKEADKICADADKALDAEISAYAKENGIDLEHGEPSKDEQNEVLRAIVLPNVAKQGEDIAALTPPEGDEETIEKLTDSLASGVAEAEDDPIAATEEGGPLEDASKQADAYGFQACGQ